MPSSTRPWASRDAAGQRGAGRIRLHDLDLVPDVSGALYVPDYRTLIAADLHLEKGSAFAARGVPLPPYDTRATLAALEAVRARYRPRCVILLGDSFHDDGAGRRLDAADAQAIRAFAEGQETIWIAGNHDPQPPHRLGGRSAREVALGPVALRHEPAQGSVPEVVGHLHPVAAIARRGRTVRRRCFIADAERLVLPAFGAYAGGLDVRSRAIAVLFPSGSFRVWLLGRDSLYALPSTSLAGA